MAAVGAVVLGVMVAITIIDVGGRYFFFRPMEGAFELTGILLVIVGTWGMGYCQLLRMNIRINILADRFPIRGQSILWIVAYIISAGISALVVWQGALMVNRYMFMERGGVTEVLSIPFWPFMLLMVIGFGWVCFIFLIDIIKAVTEVFKR